MSLELDPLSLVRIAEELLEWKSSGSGLEIRNNGRGDSLRWPSDTLYPLKLAPSQEFLNFFMEPEGSLPCSQEPSFGPYSEPD
jgi:hypothetical protein